MAGDLKNILPNNKEFRCLKCSKLLGRNFSNGKFEIKCLRCGTLNKTLEDIAEQVIITDKDGVILYVNKAIEKVSGFSLSECIGKKPSDLWGGNMTDVFYKKMWKSLKKSKAPKKFLITNKNKKGVEYNIQLQVSPILDVYGEIMFFVGVEVSLD